MVGIKIYSILSASTSLAALVGSNLNAYYIPENELLPAVIYRIADITPEYTKEGAFQDVSTVEILSFSEDYRNCLDISAAVRNALDNYKDEEVTSIRIKQITEGYDFEMNVFHSKITLTIKTNI